MWVGSFAVVFFVVMTVDEHDGVHEDAHSHDDVEEHGDEHE